MAAEDVYNFDIELEDGNSQDSETSKSTIRDLKPLIQEEEANECKLCKRTFATVPGLKRHMRACEKTHNPVKEESLINEIIVETDEYIVTELPEGDFILPDIEESLDGTGIELATIDAVKCDPSILNTEDGGKCRCCGEDVENNHSVGTHECVDCKKLFRLETSLLRHNRIVHGDGPLEFNCSECNKTFGHKRALLAHIRTIHREDDGKQVECPVCHKTFSRRYHLVRHNMQTGCDGSERPAYPCQVCFRVFNRKDNLREHLRAHAGETKRKKLYTCEFCNKEFRGAVLLNAHKRTHTGDKPHACDECPKRFPSKGALKKHKRKHTGERPYQCKLCFARFSAKETLNRHTRIHTGVRPHSCLYCGKSFIQASQLRAHVFHHTGENGYTCEVCGKAFNRRSRLDLHVKYVHEGAKPFNCETCKKTFVRKEDLARHNVLHSGVKAHKCAICNKGFAMKSSLKIHLLTHTKEPPRSCDECGRAFIRQDCLLRHMRTKHREMLEEIMAEAEKKKLQAQLLAMAAASNAEEEEEEDAEEGCSTPAEFPTFMSDEALTESIGQLISLLVDEVTLKSFGWPSGSVDKLLESVIKRCGHAPATADDLPYPDRLRENAKLLFTVVIDDSAVKTLLNNQTVDEVILHVLKLAKT